METMAIERKTVDVIAEVSITDDYEVLVHQRGTVEPYSPHEARKLARELVAAAEEAFRMRREDAHLRFPRAVEPDPEYVDPGNDNVVPF